jgi:hypothetical protein
VEKAAGVRRLKARVWGNGPLSGPTGVGLGFFFFFLFLISKRLFREFKKS